MLIWPDNVQAYNVFVAMETQWLSGPGGPTGLIYSSLDSVMRHLEIVRSERHDVFLQVRVMEREVLTMLQEERAKNG